MNTESNELPQIPDPPIQVSDNSGQDSGAAVTPGFTTQMPAIADDADLIEKEWVEKAKQILNETRDDPYIMNQQMTAMKADYLKKRYDKDVKVP